MRVQAIAIAIVTVVSAAALASPPRTGDAAVAVDAMRLRPTEKVVASGTAAPALDSRSAAAAVLERVEATSRALQPTWHPSSGPARTISVVPFSSSYSIGVSLRIVTP